ncbi:MAG: fumarylacetoacetate hydrolase family protein [Gammaproteobacteria bacterium]|nr:fumarylacetoacetate hydrolase family protein [Gammaproteobacteria bacterium]
MRLVTCIFEQQRHLGVVTGDDVFLPARSGNAPAEFRDMLALIDGGKAALTCLTAAMAAENSNRVPLANVEVLAPIPRPRKNIVCLGWNYFDHAKESAAVGGRTAEIPEHPVVFTKNVTSVNGPYADIPAQPDVTQQLDWEVELGVIIGSGGRNIPEDRALAHVFGYTVINDVSARDLQFRHKQYFLGKSLDGACPMGPWLVTSGEIADPQNLQLRSWVNGVLKQHANTRDMIFSVARTIAILSRGMTLEPGDIIATGTPAGVGFARTPPEFMKAGDVVECEVAGIGRIKNRIA